MSQNDKRKTTYPCLKCNKHVKRGDKAVICGLCDQWVHKDCEQMDDETYKVIERQGTLSGKAVWICQSCSSYSAKLEKRMREFDKQLTAVETRVGAHDTALGELKAEVIKLQEDSAKGGDIQDVSDKVQTKAAETVFKEINERDERRHKAVIHGLNEAASDVVDSKARMAKDIEKLEELVAQLDLQIDMASVRFTKRLGTKTGNESRPLLVQFKESKDRDNLLDNAKNLNTKPAEWKKVKVVCDLTKMQREEETRMRAEAVNLTDKLKGDDAKNFEYRMVGRRGERKILKVKKKEPGVAAGAKAEGTDSGDED